jgi:hypothetical protein
MPQIVDAERQRIEQSRAGTKNWRRWGPYVSERQWGTVREDYSPFGTAWDYLTHDQARSRAYRWGEDGIAGFCDDQQLLCLSIALWKARRLCLRIRSAGSPAVLRQRDELRATIRDERHPGLLQGCLSRIRCPPSQRGGKSRE